MANNGIEIVSQGEVTVIEEDLLPGESSIDSAPSASETGAESASSSVSDGSGSDSSMANSSEKSPNGKTLEGRNPAESAPQDGGETADTDQGNESAGVAEEPANELSNSGSTESQLNAGSALSDNEE